MEENVCISKRFLVSIHEKTTAHRSSKESVSWVQVDEVGRALLERKQWLQRLTPVGLGNRGGSDDGDSRATIASHRYHRGGTRSDLMGSKPPPKQKAKSSRGIHLARSNVL